MYSFSPPSQRHALALIIGATFALAGCQKPASDPAATSASAPAPSASTAALAAPPYTAPSAAQLTQLVAPIALFPDKLLAQVLAGSTYPEQIAEAAVWRQRNASLKPADMAAASNVQRWDPSVKSLTAFPSVLAQLAGNPDWSRALGEAYVNEPGAVMNAIQALRQQAMAHGKLKSSAQLHVSVAKAPTVQYAVPDQPYDPAYPRSAPPPPALSQIIEIAPAQPDTVYVPEYDPQVVYGEAVQPYPGYHYRFDDAAPHRDHEAGRDALLFGAGVLVGVVAGRERDTHWNAWGMNWTPRPDHDGARDRSRETGPDRDRAHDDGRDGHRTAAVAPGVTYNNSPYVSRSTTIVNNNVNNVNNVNTINNVNNVRNVNRGNNPNKVPTVDNDSRGATQPAQALAPGLLPTPGAGRAGPAAHAAADAAARQATGVQAAPARAPAVPAPARPTVMGMQAPEQRAAQPTAPGAIIAGDRRQHREPLRLGAPEAPGTQARPASPNPGFQTINTGPRHRESPNVTATPPHSDSPAAPAVLSAPAAPAVSRQMRNPDERAMPPRPAANPPVAPGRMQHELRQAPVAVPAPAPTPAPAPAPVPHAEGTGMHRGAAAVAEVSPMPHPQAAHPAPAAPATPPAPSPPPAAPHVATPPAHVPAHVPAGTPGTHEGRHTNADGNTKPEPASKTRSATVAASRPASAGCGAAHAGAWLPCRVGSPHALTSVAATLDSSAALVSITLTM